MREISDESGLWLRRYHAAPDHEVTLVCFPHAGGAASYYLPVSKALAPAVETLAVQYPGRHDRLKEQPAEDIRVLATSVVRALAPWLDGNLAFFGHSMGAIVAFEAALQLESQRNKTLDALFVSGRPAPFRYRDENVHLKGDVGIIAELKKISATDEQFLRDDELLTMILPALRADFKAIETYRYQPGSRLGTPIIALTGAEDPRASIEEVEDWREVATSTFDMQVFPGGHFYLNYHAAGVIKSIANFLLPT